MLIRSITCTTALRAMRHQVAITEWFFPMSQKEVGMPRRIPLTTSNPWPHETFRGWKPDSQSAAMEQRVSHPKPKNAHARKSTAGSKAPCS